MTYLHHVTLTTGHVRRSPREEIAPATWQPVSDLLSAAMLGPAPIPGVGPGYTLTVSLAGRCLLCTVLHHAAPLCTIGVGTHSRCGSTLWSRLHQGGGLATRAEDIPPEPWCASRLEPGIITHPDAGHWIGDLERCIAWVWIERDRGDRG